MRYLLVGATLALLALGTLPTSVAAQTDCQRIGMGWLPASEAWQADCRWIGQGEALLCGNPGGWGPTVSAWQGSGWTTVPAGSGLFQPVVGGGLSTYGYSYPASPVTPTSSYYAQNWLGNTLTQTSAVYGPGSTSRAVTCTAWYSGYASGLAYQTCR